MCNKFRRNQNSPLMQNNSQAGKQRVDKLKQLKWDSMQGEHTGFHASSHSNFGGKGMHLVWDFKSNIDQEKYQSRVNDASFSS